TEYGAMSGKSSSDNQRQARPPEGAPDVYRTLGTFAADEVVIKRSRFIGWGAPFRSEDEALAVLEQIRAEHAQATHNCYAYRVGFGVETVRFSDDGEPGGTAGKPIVACVQRDDVRIVIIVFSRYFGGLRLRSGGLVRAYAQQAKMAVEAYGTTTNGRQVRLAMELEYEWYGRLKYDLQERGVIIVSSA